MATIKEQAVKQIKSFLGNGANKPMKMYWSTQQSKGELLYIDYSKHDLITEDKMNEIQETLNNGFKGHGITVNVRKNFLI